MKPLGLKGCFTSVIIIVLSCILFTTTSFPMDIDTSFCGEAVDDEMTDEVVTPSSDAMSPSMLLDHSKRVYWGEEVQLDYDKTRQELLMVAEQTEDLNARAWALFYLGKMYYGCCIHYGMYPSYEGRDTLYDCSKLKMTRGDSYEEAKRYFELAVDQDDNLNVKAWSLLCLSGLYLHGKHKNYTKAIELFHDVLGLCEDDKIRAWVWYSLGILYCGEADCEIKNFDVAIDNLKKAIKQDVNFLAKKKALWAMADLLLKGGDRLVENSKEQMWCYASSAVRLERDGSSAIQRLQRDQ